MLDAELIRARAILRDEIDDMASRRYLPWLYTQDSETDIWNGTRENRLWEKSNPTLGIVKQYSYLEQQVDLARQDKRERAFVLSKDFNLKQNNAEAWLMLEDYDYDEVFDLEDFKGALCLGAVDIALTTDLSCAKVLLMKKDDPRKYIHTMYFIPEGKLENADDRDAGAKYKEWAQEGLIRVCPGNYLDVTVIADWFAELYYKHKLRLYKCGYDQRFSREFVERMEAYGFECEMILQNAETLNLPTKMVEADLKSRHIIGNNIIDKWCFSNSALKVDAKSQGLVVKIDGQDSRKIDGAVTTIILFEVFRRWKTDFVSNLRG